MKDGNIFGTYEKMDLGPKCSRTQVLECRKNRSKMRENLSFGHKCQKVTFM